MNLGLRLSRDTFTQANPELWLSEIEALCNGPVADDDAGRISYSPLRRTLFCDDKSASDECNQALADRFGIQAVPTTLLIDADGRVIAMALRPFSGDSDSDLERWLDKLLPN